MNKTNKMLIVILILSAVLLTMIFFHKFGVIAKLAQLRQESQGITQEGGYAGQGTEGAGIIDGEETPSQVAVVVPAKASAIPDAMYEGLDTRTASLTAIGDVMMHRWQIERGYDAATDSFDYAESFTYIEPYLSHADFTFGNLETTFAGRNNGYSKDVYGYSGYPTFNSPEIISNNIQAVGVDMLATANNHSLDSGTTGINGTIDYLDSIGIKHLGTYKTEAERNEDCIVEVNGITFGFVDYTYGTNGIPVPDSMPWCINTLTGSGEPYEPSLVDEMCEKVRHLDEAGVDVVMPIIHFGTEYWDNQDTWQEMCVNRLFEAGADVIVGGHPHVVEPVEIREITNPDGTKRTGYVIYSLGNFISSQVYDGVWKDIGLVMDMEFERKGNGETRMTKWAFAPTYVYWTDDVIGVVPVIEAHDHPENYSFLSAKDWDRINASYGHTIETMTAIEKYPYTIEDNRYTFTIDRYEGF